MLRPARRRGLHRRIRRVTLPPVLHSPRFAGLLPASGREPSRGATDEDKASMAKVSLPLPPLLVHALVLAACFFHPCPTQPQGRTENISAIEAAVRARTSELLRDTTTNTSQLVDLPLPANLSGVGGVRAWALRVRSNALWADGVNATGFTVPPRIVPAPFARRRLTIVFERFVGNSTAAFAAPRRYALAVPVAGLLAYDASAGPDARVSLRLLS